METTEIKFYKLLKKYQFSEEDAGEFVALQKEMQHEDLATKVDLNDVKTALTADIVNTRSDLIAEISNVRAEMSKIKSDLTWRMFIFWLGQVAATLAIVRYALA